MITGILLLRCQPVCPCDQLTSASCPADPLHHLTLLQRHYGLAVRVGEGELDDFDYRQYAGSQEQAKITTEVTCRQSFAKPAHNGKKTSYSLTEYSPLYRISVIKFSSGEMQRKTHSTTRVEQLARKISCRAGSYGCNCSFHVIVSREGVEAGSWH